MGNGYTITIEQNTLQTFAKVVFFGEMGKLFRTNVSHGIFLMTGKAVFLIKKALHDCV
jgi:hypothetical protein